MRFNENWKWSNVNYVFCLFGWIWTMKVNDRGFWNAIYINRCVQKKNACSWWELPWIYMGITVIHSILMHKFAMFLEKRCFSMFLGSFKMIQHRIGNDVKCAWLLFPLRKSLAHTHTQTLKKHFPIVDFHLKNKLNKRIK